MNNQPLVSILIPTFNREDVIERALKSALIQTYSNTEVVVVDDGSVDTTEEILQVYLREYENLRYLKHSENRGITSARNTLLDNAQGEWIVFLSSDDELLPDAVETVIKFAEKNPDVNWFHAHMIDAATGEYACLDEYTGYMPKGAMTHATKAGTSNESLYMVKRELFGTERFVEGLNNFESELLLKLANKAVKYFINQPAYIYHTEYENRTSTSYERGTNTMSAGGQWIKLLKERPEYLIDRRKHGLEDMFIEAIRQLVLAGEYEMAEEQISYARKCGVAAPSVKSLIKEFTPPVVRTGFVERFKQVVVKVLRILKLKPPKPPEE